MVRSVNASPRSDLRRSLLWMTTMHLPARLVDYCVRLHRRLFAPCLVCQGVRWVCASHPDKPWGLDGLDVPGACNCGPASGCPRCNPSRAAAPCQQAIP